jgi:hypothetical protein
MSRNTPPEERNKPTPIINKVLALMRRYFQKHLKESLELLDELATASAEVKK